MSLVAENLSVGFRRDGETHWVVKNVSLTLRPGQVTALVGESGSGKSVLAKTLVGLSGNGAVVEASRLNFDDRDIRGLEDREWRALRGRTIGFIPQDVLVSLDPLRRLGDEVGEALKAHRWGTRAMRKAKVLLALASAGLDDPAQHVHQRSGALSGGMRQRGLIASAIVMDPDIVIADEPTTALDPIVQLRLLALFRDLKERNKAILIISHDLDFVARIADEILVMNRGAIVEAGRTEAVTRSPHDHYTRMLIDASPSRIARPIWNGPKSRDADPIFDVRRVGKAFVNGSLVQQAVRDVSFSVRAGDTLGIIGSSGSGKTTLTRLLMGLAEPSSGEILFNGIPWNRPAAQRVPERARRAHLGKIGMIYQDPLGSFDPRWNVRKIIEDAARGRSAGAANRSVNDLLALVRLDHAIADRHPLRLSGGQRQRVAIARALAGDPAILICDEPVSALDLSVQAQVLSLLASLREELGLAIIMVSHDMAVIQAVCDNVLVMQGGTVVETGPTDSIFHAPNHEFTRNLISAAFGSTERAQPVGAELV